MDEQDPTAPAEDTATSAEAPVAPEAAPATPEAEPVTVEAPVEEPVMDDPRADTAEVVEEESSSPESGVIKDEYMVQ